MTRDQYNKWIAALRSGEFGQTTKVMKDENSFCCLGLFCHVNGLDNMRRETLDYANWVGNFYASNGRYQNDESPVLCLAEYNDIGKTFVQIADIIEANLEGWVIINDN
jgi:hypothetical protein